MAAVVDAKLQALQEKRESVQRMVDEALADITLHEMTSQVVCTISRDLVGYMGHCGWNSIRATDNDWNRVLSEGLGTKFTFDWDHTKYFREDLRVLRLGEPIFEVMRARGLNPEWDGTAKGHFTITAVDTVGAKLALAMALHPRLGADSPLSLVSPMVQILLLACVQQHGAHFPLPQFVGSIRKT